MADSELLAAIKGEMGKQSEAIIARIAASEEKVKALDERVAKIGTTAEGDAAKSDYFRALQNGQPFTMRAEESVDEAIERVLAERQESTIMRAVTGRGSARGARVRRREGLDAARILRAFMVAKRDRQFSSVTADDVLGVLGDWGDKRTQGLVEQARDSHKMARELPAGTSPRKARALSSAILGEGAGFVTPDVWAGFVDFLWPQTVVRSLGAMSVPTSKNAISMLYGDSAAGASYRGQLQHAAQTQFGEKRLQLVLKLLSGFIAVSNELIDEADIAMDVFIRNVLTRAIALAEDRAFILSLGSENEPKGMDWWFDNANNPMVPAANRFNRSLATGNVTFRTIRTDLLRSMEVTEDSNVPAPSSPGWAFSVFTKYGLMRALNVNDLPVFGEEMRGGTLMGAPFGATTVIPRNLVGDGAGSGTGNKGRIYRFDAGSAVIAEQPGVETKVVDGGAYRDSTGNVIAGLTSNETVVVVHAKNDLGFLYRGREGSIIDSVDYGNVTF
jgi:HK97 family phage major capsid protein